MEIIRVNCVDCNCIEQNIDKHYDAIVLESDCKIIESIINSSYLTHIEFCGHKSIHSIISLKRGISMSSEKNYHCVRNFNYAKFYGVYGVKKDEETSSLIIYKIFGKEISNPRVSIEDFIRKIKKGTIIHFRIDDLGSEFELIFLEHNNTDFILKKIIRYGFHIYMIDTPILTKPSLVLL